MHTQQSTAPRTGIQGSGKSISGNVVECISCRAR